MNVKAANSGVRKPSPILWVMVQRVPEDQWRQLKAFSEVYGKRSMQFKLIEFLRGMKEYDSQAEKDAFADCDLYSLRKKAKAWLVRTGRRLAFAAKEVDEQLGDVELLVAWGHFAEAWDMVAEVKRLAIAQEEFIVLMSLLEQERVIAKELFQGAKRTEELARIASENRANLANLEWLVRLREYHAQYLEPVRNELASAGTVDRESVGNYFNSEVALMSLDGLPSTIKLEKLLLDEFFLNLSGKLTEAIDVAQQMLEVVRSHRSIIHKRPDLLSKTFRRLAVLHGSQGNLSALQATIADFQSENPTSPENRTHALLRFVFVLYYAAMDFGLPEYGARAQDILTHHIDFIREQPVDDIRSTTFLYAAWYYLGQGQIDPARRLFRDIEEAAPKITRLLYQSMLGLLHIVLELEDKNEIGLDAICLRYQRKLGKLAPSGSTILVAIASFRKSVNAPNPKARASSLKQLAEELRRRQLLPDEERNLWYEPLLGWIERYLGAQ